MEKKREQRDQNERGGEVLIDQPGSNHNAQSSTLDKAKLVPVRVETAPVKKASNNSVSVISPSSVGIVICHERMGTVVITWKHRAT